METLREQCERRLDALKDLREDYEEDWFEVSKFAQPARSRYLAGRAAKRDSKERSRRRHRNNKIMDPKGIEAFRTLTNGMTSGLTSASRPWFTLGLPDDSMMDEEGVRDWLSEVEKRMYRFLAGTNFYGMAKAGYAEMGLFGVEACVMMEHPVHGAALHTLTAGEYWIACGDAMMPDVLYRVCPMTVREVMQVFGADAPKHVKMLYDQGSYTDIIDIYHAIEPDKDYDARRFASKPWRSVYWCREDDTQGVMRVRGYNEQPFWSPRWDVTSGETYGTSPAMDCLPALRELQMQAKRRGELIDQLAHPEKIVPPNVRLTGQARRVVTASGVTKDNVIVPYQVPYQAVAAVSAEIDKCHLQIDALSYAELFNAITNMQGIQPRTVEEIAARNEEKLTQLGPVIERVSTEKLEIVIERTFAIMNRGGLLPPVPQALSEAKINVEFVSILTQMQRMVGIGQIERTAAFIGNLAGLRPDAADKLDVDEMIDEYADRAGSPPRMIRSEDEVNKDREARAQQQQQMQMAEAMPAVREGAEAARLLSEADSSGRTVLDRLTPA